MIILSEVASYGGNRQCNKNYAEIKKKEELRQFQSDWDTAR
jgi:hypothetical protein